MGKSWLERINIVRSKLDRTVKYIYLSRGNVTEFSYIDKNDPKDIICVPTQTGCKMGCKFCFLTDYDLAVRNLAPEEISLPTVSMVHRLSLTEKPARKQVLLVSFMGCGEPLNNIENVIEAMKSLRRSFFEKYHIVRFAVATLMPHEKLAENLILAVKKENLPVKLHLSLHTPDAKVRKEIMPAAIPADQSLDLLEKFRKETDNSVEVHYSLIDGVNDRDVDMQKLSALLKTRGIPVKFLIYNEKPSVTFRQSKRVSEFRKHLEREGIASEFYIPPGGDIGSSCGQFLMDYYAEYNSNKKSKE